jgi:hypothetical protein
MSTKIKIFIAEDYKGEIYFSEKSHEEIINGTTADLMPGSFQTADLSQQQFDKLQETDGDGCATHYMKNTAGGIKVFQL